MVVLFGCNPSCTRSSNIGYMMILGVKKPQSLEPHKGIVKDIVPMTSISSCAMIMSIYLLSNSIRARYHTLVTQYNMDIMVSTVICHKGKFGIKLFFIVALYI